MPTSLGHALAGLTVLWCAQAAQHRRQVPSEPLAGGPDRVQTSDPLWQSRGMAVACVCLAVAPDLDLLMSSHRTVTHSVTSAVGVGLAAALAMRGLGKPALRVGLVLGLIWGSHAGLDWLGRDSSLPYGIMALWPISERWFTSNLNLFSEVSRRYWLPRSFWLGNLASVARELAILGPFAAGAWWLARRGRAPGSRNGNPEPRIQNSA